MNSALTSIILLAALVAVVLLGRRLQRRLPVDHLSADSKDAVKLAIVLVATMTALLLGLLVSSAKGSYDIRRTEVIEIAGKITLLDRVLTAYGPDAAEARARFREAVAEGVRSASADAAAGRVHMFPITQADYRSYAAIMGLSPRDDMQREGAGGDPGLRPSAASRATASAECALDSQALVDRDDLLAGGHLPRIRPACAGQRHDDARPDRCGRLGHQRRFPDHGARPAAGWHDQHFRRASVECIEAIHTMNS